MTGSIVRLKDAEGNIINIPASKGKDGISPLLRKSDTAIEVSYDGGATYTAEFKAAEAKFYVYRGSARYTVKAYAGTSRVQGYIGTKRIF